ncbi:MAG: radical SAM protein [Candidatus Omnitrophota bacterium]
MNDKIDIVLINPGDRRQVYQELGQDYSAVEPPYWIAVIAAYLRNINFRVMIIDANAENISPEETSLRVNKIDPVLSAVIVYGSQPSASTQNMTIAGKICRALKSNPSLRVAIGGLHPSALPRMTMQDEDVDFVIEGEGLRTLSALIKALKAGREDYSGVPGLWYRQNGAIKHNTRAKLIEDLSKELALAAWDLLPMDKYKAHNWHCFDDIEHRMPYAAIYTSLGCPYSCIFCCINALFAKPGIRYRNPELVVEEIGTLVKKYGVKNIKVADELFVLDEKHYMKIVDLLIDKNYDLNIWVYARVDTVKFENLEKMKKAGINWIALGIESANPQVRDGAAKRMMAKDIYKVVRNIQDAGIRVIGNFIFGLPDDDLKTMQETLDMAIQLNCEFVNFYYGMAYPGSRLYDIAIKQGWKLPGKWHGFSQHSYEALPLPTKYLSAEEVLRFRDNAFDIYYRGSGYLDMIETKFGRNVREHIQGMTKLRLKRKILENQGGGR